MANVFVSGNNITFDELNKLKRVPKSFHHQRVTISRFICAFLPTISKVLWEHSINELDKLAAAVSKLNSDARERPVDEEKYKNEMREVVNSKYENKRTFQKKQAMGNLYAKHKPSNQWGVVK